ncbi:MAG: dUTP diphosphatase [Zetaproteobacteria bacterium]|nr:dUTP diphosphatase [Zetaproteobacteria bacterium]
MIYLRYASDNLAPSYATLGSSAADLCAREAVALPAHGHAKVPTGVWIERVDWECVPEGLIPELQVRARSGLAAKKQVMLTNGVGTIDADYPGEICVLLTNLGSEPLHIEPGMRIAQLLMQLVYRLPDLPVLQDARVGGFGSTGVHSTSPSHRGDVAPGT